MDNILKSQVLKDALLETKEYRMLVADYKTSGETIDVKAFYHDHLFAPMAGYLADSLDLPTFPLTGFIQPTVNPYVVHGIHRTPEEKNLPLDYQEIADKVASDLTDCTITSLSHALGITYKEEEFKELALLQSKYLADHEIYNPERTRIDLNICKDEALNALAGNDLSQFSAYSSIAHLIPEPGIYCGANDVLVVLEDLSPAPQHRDLAQVCLRLQQESLYPIDTFPTVIEDDTIHTLNPAVAEQKNYEHHIPAIDYWIAMSIIQEHANPRYS
ncbi:MAG: hypothetical protein ACQESG_04040 [Nanobdellota archaeon]